MNRDEIRAKLTTALHAQLDEMVKANHCGAGSIVQAVERAELRARLASVDRLACEVELISVTCPRLGALDVDELRDLADHLAKELSYLEERLVVLEIDQKIPQIQLRSDAPRVDQQCRSYFELQVGKLGVTLQRFVKQAGSTQRKTTPAPLTRRVFQRVCVDLLAAVQG